MDPPGATTTPRLHKADLHLLAVFTTVAECGGFAAAQVALNVSQSTISRQIGDLEKRLGLRLYQRGRSGFRLTDKGRIVYEACQHLSTALESFRTAVGALRGELVGDLSIAAIDNWATERGYPMADVLRAFRAKADRDIGVRYFAANCQPDHVTVCTFRRNNFDAVAEAFVQVLLLANELKLLRVGTVTLLVKRVIRCDPLFYGKVGRSQRFQTCRESLSQEFVLGPDRPLRVRWRRLRTSSSSTRARVRGRTGSAASSASSVGPKLKPLERNLRSHCGRAQPSARSG